MSNEIKPVIVPEKIHLLKVNLIQGNLVSEEDFLTNPKPADRLEVNIAHHFRFDFDEKRILIRLIINIVGLHSDKNPLGISASYALDFFFTVDNLNDFITHNKNHKTVADILGATLLSVSISTARGILLERTHGTFFEGFMLPIVDPMKLIREQTPHTDSAKKSSSK